MAAIGAPGDCVAERGATGKRIIADPRGLGVGQGDTLLVHGSLRSIGLVDGGAGAVAGALREAAGTVVVPAGTEQNSKTSRQHLTRIAGMTPQQVLAYRAAMPAFHPGMPSGMGAIAEAVRTARGAVRSGHPQSSFAAVGAAAEYLMDDHRVDCHYGEDSPLAKLYKMDARVLLLGVGYRACTAFHLAEYRYTPNPPRRGYECVVTGADGQRCWTSYDDVVLDDHEFEVIGQSFEKETNVDRGDVGNAECRLMSLRDAVDFAVQWMSENRTQSLCQCGLCVLCKCLSVSYSEVS
jgi:aminoglycoside 3-N-acetyltransferase